MPMPGWAKALIIVFVVIVLLVAGVVAAGVFWWSRNKDALVAKGKAVVEDGREAGRNSDNQGCVDQSISRYKQEPGFASAISNSIFMQTCLDISRPTSGFCDDVPKQLEFTKSAQWRVAQCSHFDLSSDRYCQQLFQPVQNFCERRTRRSQENSEANTQ